MRRAYPYLTDINFLDKIYDQHNKTVYTEITVLDWYERPIAQAQGRILNASISLNGDSSIRRTANLSVKIKDASETYTNIDSLFSINKKIFIETGIKNGYKHLGQEFYSNYDVIWFPFGVFVITGYSINHDNSGVIINLSLSDKMCLLNGSAGGVIPASVNFESYDTLGSDGDLHSEPIRINQIIPELVNHFGGEDLNHIMVNDIPDKIKQVLRWLGTNPLFLYQDKNNLKNSFYTTIQAKTYDLSTYGRTQFTYNYDCGYTYTDFTYPGELGAGAGDSVCTVLDKIKELLGNYEYYYDVFGNFIFQEIKNYVNTTEWRTAFNNYHPGSQIELPYAYNTVLNSHVYDLSKHNFVISYSNNPKFDMIKNDFVVWGERQGPGNIKLPCRYHLAIDERPFLTEDWDVTGESVGYGICFDTHVDDKIRRAHVITEVFDSVTELENKYPFGIVGKYYLVDSNNVEEKGIYTWVTDIDGYNLAFDNMETAAEGQDSSISENAQVSKTTKAGYVRLRKGSYYTSADDNPFVVSANTDWRNILYWRGLLASFTGTDTGYYWAELCNEWPKVYDIEHDTYYQNTLDSPSSLDWWLDIVDSDATLNEFSVVNIGRRSYSKTDSGCNCVFESLIPDIIMIDVDKDEDIVDTRSQMTGLQLSELGLIPIQVKTPVYESTGVGGIFNSCYEHVKQVLEDYVNYNESINISCLPLYHLEPNTRIHVEDPESGIFGDYIINTISYNLGNGDSMSLSARKVIEKI